MADAGAAPAATLATLMGMAKSAELAGNNEEALTYYNRALEAEPRNPDAWIGKGKAAAWQSTLRNIRINEMLIAFGHAMANTEPAEKDTITQLVVNEANSFVVTIYGMARNHMLEYVTLQNSWSDYLNQMSTILTALETIHSWNPDNKITLENIVHICKDNIEGVSYRDQFDYNTPKSWSLSPEYEKLVKKKLDLAAAKLRTLDPAYEPPAIEKKKAEDCFVITATMGDPLHPHVKFLQSFRDDWLSRRDWGSAAIRCYYRFGPTAAAFIGKSDLRRSISHRLVVRPAVWVARHLGRNVP